MVWNYKFLEEIEGLSVKGESKVVVFWIFWEPCFQGKLRNTDLAKRSASKTDEA